MKKIPIRINKEYLIKICIEIFSVVFAVLLALWVNDWKQNQQNERRVKQAKLNLQEEITLNKDRIENSIPRYNNYLEAIDSIIIQFESNRSLNNPDFPDISFDIVTLAAWEAVKATDAINYMDFNHVLNYSSLYSVQEIYMKQVESYIYDKKLIKNTTNNKEALELLNYSKQILDQIKNTSEQLLNIYKDMIEYLYNE